MRPRCRGLTAVVQVNPYASATSPDGKGRPELDAVRPWDSHRAAVDVSGAPFVDLAAEARMAFMRD